MEVKHMLSQYYGMNASHLTIDEFSHELHIRKLPLDGARSQLEKDTIFGRSLEFVRQFTRVSRRSTRVTTRLASPGNLGKTGLIEHKIELKEEFQGADPVRKNPYPWSPEIQRRIHRAVDLLLRDDIIEPSSSEWALPVVPTFDIGQRVFKRSFKQSSAGDNFNAKLGPPYTPCTITAKKGTSSYAVSDMNGKPLGVFSAADLKA